MDEKSFFLLLLFVFFKPCISRTYAQLNIDSKNHYVWFDETVGNGNLAIYNGTIFVEKFKAPANNHRFLLDNSYHLGNLIYDNQPYYDIYLKYDIYEDEIIAKLDYKTNSLYIKLIKEKISYFEIYSSELTIFNEKLTFIDSATKPAVSSKKFSGFYQVLYEFNEITLMKKNFKKRDKKIIDNLVYSNFLNKDVFIILKENNYYVVDSKYDLIKLFPKQKKYISIFYRRNRKLLKEEKDTFYTNLVKDIHASINKSENK
tara:strand:+ start:72 stop:848 length:777 start_codon:yes stop_codon:yes gene_type:complete